VPEQALTTFHRALGDARRARLVDELEAAHEPLDAAELGRRVESHPNTVRFHLAVLADAGLVRSRPAPRRTPGRPRIVYELTADGRPGRADEYRLLATALAGVAGATPAGVAACEETGRAWGRELVRRPRDGERTDDDAAVGAVVDLLAEQGFEPTAGDGTIEMRRCPFHALAETSPAVVCGLHRGLIDGALEASGSELAVARLEVFPEPDLCVAWLRDPVTGSAAPRPDTPATP
jgi:predicted ArsR family transcriptional regulator